MKKLFYLLFCAPFLLYSCSDDDSPVTEDVNYNIVFTIYESSDDIGKNQLHIRTLENWFAEKSLGKVQMSTKLEGHILWLDFNDLEYVEYKDPMLSRSPQTRTSMVGYASTPPIDLTDNISKIIATRKGKQDIYTINREEKQITIIQNGSSFSNFQSSAYLLRPQNIVAFHFYKMEPYKDEFLNLLRESVELETYTYDESKGALWFPMRDGPSYYSFYSYKNKDDFKKIEEVFKAYCKQLPKTDQIRIMSINDWKGQRLDYYMAIE